MRLFPAIFLCLISIVPIGSSLTGAQDAGSSEETLNPQGYKLHLLYDPPVADVDIVAVHGLDGHWKRSWTAENHVYWLQDLLPRLLPQARIFSFGYDSRTRGANRPLKLDISDHGKDLLASLVHARHISNTKKRPLIFIGHSLGGLVIKEALIHSDMARVGHLERQKDIQLSTHSVLFFGTPHQGGQGIPLMKIIIQIMSITSYTNPHLLNQLTLHSESLQSLQERYTPVSKDFETVFFYETEEMPLPVGRILVVPKFSAVIQGAVNTEDVALSADHSTMVKYAGMTEPNFEKVVQRLQILVSDAGLRVRQNWTRRMGKKGSSTRTETGESASPGHPREYQVGLLVQQVQNHQFVGRHQTLLQMRQFFSAPSSQHDDAYRLLVLYGLGGVGKTQLALEYAYSSSSKYSAVIWIDYSSLEMAVFSIQRHLHRILHYYESIGLGQSHARYHKIKQVLDDIAAKSNSKKAKSPGISADASADVNRMLIDTFADWLSHDSNRHWLLVLDNVDDLESFDYRYLLLQIRWGDVLVTSRRKDLASQWDFIEVASMDEDDAMQLLMTSANIDLQPESKDWEDGRQLIEKLGYFPLAIVQAGSFLAVQQPRNPMVFYMDLLQNFPRTALSHRGAQAAWDYRNDTALTTWEISYEAVRKQMPRAAHILQLCAFLNREEINEDIFVLGMPSQGPDDKIQVLQSFHLLMRYSLVQRTNGTSGYTLHPVVHTWAKLRLDSRDQAQMALESLLMLSGYGSVVKDMFYGTQPHLLELLSFYETEYPCHPEDILEENPIRDPPTWIQKLTATWYWADGHWGDAMSFVSRKLSDSTSSQPAWVLIGDKNTFPIRYNLRARALGWASCQAAVSFGSSWHPRALYLLGNYAFSLYNEGNMELSFRWYHWLLSVRKLVYGPEHPATTGTLIGLARTSDNCENATGWAITAYTLRLKRLGPDDLLTRNAFYVVHEMINACVHADTKADIQWLLDDMEHRGGVSMARDIIGWLKPQGWVKLASAYLQDGKHQDGTSLLCHLLQYADDCSESQCDWLWKYEAQATILFSKILEVVDQYAILIIRSTYIQDLVAALERRWKDLAIDAQSQQLPSIIRDGRICGRMSIAITMAMIHAWMDKPDLVSLWFTRWISEMLPGWLDSGICLYSASPNIGPLPTIYLMGTAEHTIYHSGPLDINPMTATIASTMLNPLLFREVSLGIKMLLSHEDVALCPSLLQEQLRIIAAPGLYISPTWRQALTIFTEPAKNLHEEDQSTSCFVDFRRVSMCRAEK